jgi:hypothetical protein
VTVETSESFVDHRLAEIQPDIRGVRNVKGRVSSNSSLASHSKKWDKNAVKIVKKYIKKVWNDAKRLYNDVGHFFNLWTRQNASQTDTTLRLNVEYDLSSVFKANPTLKMTLDVDSTACVLLWQGNGVDGLPCASC